MPKAAATEVFLSSAIWTLVSGGTAARMAWGRITVRIEPTNVRPMVRAASAWPSGTALMPERNASQTKADV